jgi:hypothetical protein
MRGRVNRRRLLSATLVGSALGLLGACEPAKLDGLPPPGPSAVEVTIGTQPAGATVVIDGTPMGAGPVTVKLNPGPHRVKAAKSGYFAADQKLVVASGDAPKKIELTLVSSH